MKYFLPSSCDLVSVTRNFFSVKLPYNDSLPRSLGSHFRLFDEATVPYLQPVNTHKILQRKRERELHSNTVHKECRPTSSIAPVQSVPINVAWGGYTRRLPERERE